MKTFIFLHIPIWAISSLSGQELDLFGSPRFNETCDSLDNAVLCENQCHSLYGECAENCPNPTDQEIGKNCFFNIFLNKKMYYILANTFIRVFTGLYENWSGML